MELQHQKDQNGGTKLAKLFYSYKRKESSKCTMTNGGNLMVDGQNLEIVSLHLNFAFPKWD